MRYLLILTATLSFASISSLAADSCSCGYQDPSTSLIWTDSIITYFNETSSAADINFNSTASPVPNEFATSSPSKVSGSQDWVAMSYKSNWDACWSCTFRHQMASNNTYIQNGSLNLAVQPADVENHISWGGEIISHRRDILYGSFRAALRAPAPAQGGTIFEMGISYNLSDYLSTGIYSSDDPANSTFQWSYSTSGHVAAPTRNPLFALGSNGFYEHRMDWMGPNGLRYSNDGTNASANFLDLDRKRDHVNIPTLVGPLYFKHWSNGERSQSQGPPIYHQPVGKIQYVRLFFNSSLPSRHSEFRQQCSAAPAPLCSTEDYSLRDSTPFSVESTARILASPLEIGEQLYAVISISISGGFFLLLLIHALVNRSLKAKRKEKDALAKEQQKQDQASEIDVMDEFQEKDEAALKNRSKNDFYSFGDGVFNQDKIGGSSDVSLPYSAPSARTSSWYGGVVRGIPSDNPLVSASQARLISRRTSSHVRITEEGPALIRWDPVIVEWKPQKPNDDELQLAQRADGVAQLPQAPAVVPVKGISGWISRFAKRMLVGEGARGMTASGTTKVEYLDGLRGLACFLVSFHHFMLMFYYNVTTPSGPAHYPQMERWLRNLLGAILTNGNLNVGCFFCLAARVIANKYLVRGNLQDLAEATQRRVPRLSVPISFAILLSYFLGQADAFYWIERLSSRSWSTWSYYEDYDNIGTFIDSWLSLWFTHPPNVTSMISTYPAGILWTVPLIVSSSWTVFTCALIACEIPNVKKRYCFYFACWSISWYVLKFDYFFIAGLIIADLDNKVKYRALAARGLPLFPSFISSRLPNSFAKKRIHGQVFAWAIFLTGAIVSWVDQIDGNGTTLSIRELGIHPHWQTARPRAWYQGSLVSFTDPRIFDFFFVIGFFLLCDLCSSFRTFFQLRIWSALGRNAFSLYLLHGVIFWSWGAWICLHLLAYGVPYWAAVLVTLITSYIWLAVLCEVFSRTFDKWGVSLSKSFWRECSGGLGSRA